MRKNNQEQRIIHYSIAGGLLFWVIDAFMDSAVFRSGSFLDSLILKPSAHELYFRILFFVGFVAFGIVVSRIMAKRRQVEERYENLVELSADIIYIAGTDGKIQYLNDAGCRTLGLKTDEAAGKPLLDVIHPDDRQRAAEQLTRMLADGKDSFNCEKRFVSKTGATFSVLGSIRVLRDAMGVVIGTQSICRDVTEQKRSEELLQKALHLSENEKARSMSILSAIGDGISIQNTDFKIVYQNQIHKKLSSGDCLGQTCYQAYAHREDVCPECPVAESFKDGEIHTHQKIIQTNGETRVLEIKASPLRDADGTIVAGIEAVRDITARKKADEKLKLFSEAIEAATDGIQIVDLDGAIVYSNKAVHAIYGYSPEELAGRHVNDMNVDKEFAGRVILPAIQDTGHWNGELTVIHKEGKTFPIWLSTSMVRDDTGSPIAMIGIIRDVSERKQAEDILKRHHEQLMRLVEERTRELSTANEKLRREIADREKMETELLKAQKLESLGILAGGIAHDFNNLLAAIMGNISLAMLDLNPEAGVYGQLEAAEKASLRAQDLTQQLLTFSKGGSPVKKTLSVKDLIEEAAAFALRGSRVSYDFHFDEQLWRVEADFGQISQVIHNLVINADHAMPEGGMIMITCENSTITDSTGIPLRLGDYVKISVQDHGVGITKEHLAKIFDPYFTTKQKGSGLGLATCYSIIRKHGGHISAVSELGKSTTFTLYLPASMKREMPEKKTEGMQLRTGTGKILLMDDEQNVRQTTGAVLARLGYTVEFAEDGVQAIEHYQHAREAGAPFDAVIMDLTIPGGMGGKDAVQKLLQIDPDLKAIVSSGYSNDPIMAEYSKYGFRGVVAKPYRINDLGETLQKVLRKSPV